MSLPTPPSSPALSSASDDFALLLDTELAAVASSSDDDAVATEDEEEDEEFIRESRGKRLKLDSEANDVADDDPGPVEAVNGTSCPPHPGYIWNVCIRCGEPKPNSDAVENNVALRYIHEAFELTGDELDRIREKELQQVLGKRKLFLVLDLDHTLLNSTRFSELSQEETMYLESTYMDVAKDKPLITGAPVMAGAIQAGWDGLHKLHGMYLWTKLRPFVHKFLEEASNLFELYVYTMGERTYAATMAHLLDPTGKHFKGRIISQSDSTRRQTKDLDIVLGAESAVLILDDTEWVWPKHRANLIVMERYHFFPSSCRQFCLQNPSLADALRDESENEGALANVLNVLRRIHGNYFREQEQLYNDIRDVTSVVRSEILSGCKVIFSCVFPRTTAEPELQPLWRMCVDLGAECTLTLDDSVTHVIGFDRGTDKAKWAKAQGKFLVHPTWVEAAQSIWRRPSESDYPVRDGERRAPVLTFAKTVDVETFREQEKQVAVLED